MPKKTLLSVIEHTLDEAKAEDKLVFDLRKEGTYCDYVVIASGTSDRHVMALSDRLREAVKTAFSRHPIGVEGEREGVWILMDYGEIVVHLFQPETRLQYQIEELWKTARPKRKQSARTSTSRPKGERE